MFWSWPAKSLTWQEPRSVQSFMKSLVSFALHTKGGHACMQGHQVQVRHLPGTHSVRWCIACAHTGSVGKRQRSSDNWPSEQQRDSPQMYLVLIVMSGVHLLHPVSLCLL